MSQEETNTKEHNSSTKANLMVLLVILLAVGAGIFWWMSALETPVVTSDTVKRLEQLNHVGEDSSTEKK